MGARHQHKISLDTELSLKPQLLSSALSFQLEVYEYKKSLPLYYKFKRVFETFLALFLLIGLFPLMAAIAITIYTKLGTPILFKHQRVGRFGKIFNLYKFRTMKNNSPKVHDLGYTPLIKIVNDPRVEGRLGTFLRKFKWDELPQLFNVIKGDMLLIGPRPYPIEENIVMDYSDYVRLSVHPGISGKWQVLEKHISDPQLRSEYDNTYVRELCFSKDIKIFFSTLKIVVFRGE